MNLIKNQYTKNPLSNVLGGLIHPYVSPEATLEFFETPYRHFVIRDLLKPDIYKAMCSKFPEYIDRVQKPHGAVGETGHFYKAQIYSMRDEDCVNGYDFFVWSGWKDFVANIFSLVLNNYTAYTLHYHTGSPQAPSESGWSHLDLSICSVLPSAPMPAPLAATCPDTNSAPPMQITQGCDYTDDTIGLQPHTQKVMRSVAMLYYFNNPDGLTEEDGGGTGIYDRYNTHDAIKTILPYNNSLFAFEVGPDSYHGFVGARYNRSAIVQWLHSDPSYIVSRRLPEYLARWKKYGDFFERWKKNDPWQIDMDPEYNRYFSKPLSEVVR